MDFPDDLSKPPDLDARTELLRAASHLLALVKGFNTLPISDERLAQKVPKSRRTQIAGELGKLSERDEIIFASSHWVVAEISEFAERLALEPVSWRGYLEPAVILAEGLTALASEFPVGSGTKEAISGRKGEVRVRIPETEAIQHG